MSKKNEKLDKIKGEIFGFVFGLAFIFSVVMAIAGK